MPFKSVGGRMTHEDVAKIDNDHKSASRPTLDPKKTKSAGRIGRKKPSPFERRRGGSPDSFDSGFGKRG